MTEPTPAAPPPSGSASPNPDRLTFGVLYEVSKVLESKGYGPFDGPQLVELAQHLGHFFYGSADRCYGRSADTVKPNVPSLSGDETTVVEEHRTEIARKLTALRQGRTKLDAAMTRYDQQRGIER